MNKLSSQQRNEAPRRACAVYARVSSKDQAAEGFSIPAQLDLLRTYAGTHGFTIAQEFVDVETAKAAGRTGFGEMIAFLKKHSDCGTLVEKTDRMYRNVRDWVTIDDLGVEVHFVKENVILSQDSRSHEKFMHGIKVLMAKSRTRGRKCWNGSSRRCWPGFASAPRCWSGPRT